MSPTENLSLLATAYLATAVDDPQSQAELYAVLERACVRFGTAPNDIMARVMLAQPNSFVPMVRVFDKV